MNAKNRQNIPLSDAVRDFGRNQPQAYRIIVAGALDPDWSDRLGGLRIEPLSVDAGDQPVTVLQGMIPDQALLSGVLNTLCNLRLPLLGVELIDSDIVLRTSPGSTNQGDSDDT